MIQCLCQEIALWLWRLWLPTIQAKETTLSPSLKSFLLLAHHRLQQVIWHMNYTSSYYRFYHDFKPTTDMHMVWLSMGYTLIINVTSDWMNKMNCSFMPYHNMMSIITSYNLRVPPVNDSGFYLFNEVTSSVKYCTFCWASCACDIASSAELSLISCLTLTPIPLSIILVSTSSNRIHRYIQHALKRNKV